MNGEDLGFGGIQVRSRAVIIQELENQHLCPEQMLETKSCDGECCNSWNLFNLVLRDKSVRYRIFCSISKSAKIS